MAFPKKKTFQATPHMAHRALWEAINVSILQTVQGMYLQCGFLAENTKPQRGLVAPCKHWWILCYTMCRHSIVWRNRCHNLRLVDIDWSRTTKAHHNDVIMTPMASQITSLTIVYSTVYSGSDEKKPQKTSKFPVTGFSPHKRPVSRKMFLFDDVIMPWRPFILLHRSFRSRPDEIAFWFKLDSVRCHCNTLHSRYSPLMVLKWI